MWLRSAAAFAGAMLVVAASGGCDGSREDAGPSKVELDRTTAAAPAQPAADAGLPAATPKQLWRADLPNVPSPNVARLEPVAGQLAVVSPRGLDVLDAQTGKPRWHYYEKSRLVTSYAVTADAVVVTTVAAGKDGKALLDDDKQLRTTGLDAATGKSLWDKDHLLPVTEGQQTGYHPFGSAKSGVAVLAGPDKARPTLLGIDARTGKQRWTWSNGAAQHCSFRPQDSDGSLLLFEASCGTQKTMYALDPTSGVIRWEKPVDKGTWNTRTWNGVTLITNFRLNDNESTLVGPDGKTLWKLKDKEFAATEMAVSGGRAVLTVSDHDRGFGRRIEIVNTRTGKVEKRTDARDHDRLVPAGGRVYGVRQWLGEYQDSEYGISPKLVPGALDVIDPGKGKVTTVPLPFAVVGEVPAGAPAPMLIAGDRLFRVQAQGGGLRLTAYGPGKGARPVETGGVPAADWPDACKLTAKASDVTKREPAEKKPLRLGSVSIPNWGCEVETSGRPFEFRIGWVAPDAAAATALLDGTAGEKAQGVGDDAYRVGDETGRKALIMRTGRFVVVFDDADVTPGSSRRAVIDAVDKALRSR